MAIAVLPNSTFLDFSGYRQTTATTPEAAYAIDPSTVTSAHVNVALVLGRANDPSDLIASDWATRQQTLAELTANGTLWSTYGASQSTYDAVVGALTAMGIPLLGDAAGSDGYVSSAASRTIWVSLNSADFLSLFQTHLHQGVTDNGNGYYQAYWDGSLSLPSEWNVVGIAPDLYTVAPPMDLSGGASVTLPQGPQSIGNNAETEANYYANLIGGSLYNFPLGGESIPTGTIGLIEPSTGNALNGHEANTAATAAEFLARLNAFRAGMGYTTPGVVTTVSNNGQNTNEGGGDERSLDVGVIAGAAPASPMVLYAGSGTQNHAQGTSYTTYQAAFWDLVNNPAIVSSSWGDAQQSSPGSPFLLAQQQLFVDAMLRNITVFSAVGDGGSGDEMANGLVNLQYSYASALGILVGGTSISTQASALTDTTLATVLAAVAGGDLSSIWRLISGGMVTLPQDGAATTLIESVWNQYVLTGTHLNPGYVDNYTGTGGVDPTQPTPWYQTAFGLTPTTSDVLAQVGRGAPDVSALAGGNMNYLTPDSNMNGAWPNGGTSAATPLWAALWAQMNAIFADQGLPALGYSNDLLYMAAVLAPASFNDITYGNNTSSYAPGGSITTPGAGAITATGFGYEATPGYDLATGLGTPNGLLLARALTAIAHGQMYFDTPDVLGQTVSGGWVSTIRESLLFQPVLSSAAHVELTLGGDGYGYDGHASASFAWTSQFAQQVLSPDFSADLVTLFDMQSQATPFQQSVAAGTGVSALIGGAATSAPQAELSAAFGFVDFMTASGTDALSVARSLFVAQTAGGADDVEAVVRLRQVGGLDTHVMFYKLDDMSGTVAGFAPGSFGYGQAVEAHAYGTTGGGSWTSGPGMGNYAQTALTGVDAGDLIGMALSAGGHTYYTFTAANADGVTHVWNYGLNTFGWEDVYGGGDADYNDLVVQLDFTSSAGSGWLV